MNRRQKVSLFKNEFLLGLIICFAQIPESVAFAFLANVQPAVAIHSAWIVGLICSAFGGRPAMVNGATGAFAAIIGTFIPEPDVGRSGDGIENLFLSVIIAGVLMLLAFVLRLSRFITLVPSTVMIGFCNGLAIVIGKAQLHPFEYDCKEVNRDCTEADIGKHFYRSGGELGWMIAIMLISMAIMEGIPRLPWRYAKVVPSSLLSIAIAVLIEFAIVRNTGERTNTIGDIAPFSSSTAFPLPFFADNVRYKLLNQTLAENATSVPGPLRYDMDRLSFDGTVVWNGCLLAIVGIIESLMTMEVVNGFTQTQGDRARTVLAMGAGNIVTGFFGGMGGNAMIGLSTINCLNGGKGRMAPLVTAFTIMIMVMGGYPVLNYIPVASLAGVMIVVVIHTFKWFSLPMMVAVFLPQKYRQRIDRHHKIDRIDVVVILTVTVITVLTNLVYAVGAGIALSAITYSWQSGKHLTVKGKTLEDKEAKVYEIDGPFFFANRMGFEKQFDFAGDPDRVEIHFSDSVLFDFSALEALNVVCRLYAERHKTVRVRHLHPISEKLMTKAAHLVRDIQYVASDDVDVGLNIPQDGTPQMVFETGSR